MAKSASSHFDIQVEKHVLKNGLCVLVHEDHALPEVAVNLWYHVGSKDEEPGRTGFAHLFEHMMFQGSEHYPEDFFRPLEEIGARLNGSTSEDRTNYWEVVPSAYLERALWLESDRMGWLLGALTQEKLDNQRDVVKNERRETLENEPYGIAEEMLPSILYPKGHPYDHPVIGSMEDLDRASLGDIGAFFRRYYTPRNSSLCIAGDVKPDEALGLAEKYFGSIPSGPVIPPVVPSVPRLTRAERVRQDDSVQLPRLYLCWPAPRQFTAEDAALSMLGSVLSWGKDSRLVKRLQVDEDLAQSVIAYQSSGEVCGAFTVIVTAQPGAELGKIEEIIWKELDELRRGGPSGDEIRAAVAGMKTRVIKRLQSMGGFGGVSDLLNYYQTFLGRPNALAEEIGRYEAVEPEDVQEAASRHLDPCAYGLLQITPREGKAVVEPGRASLPGAGEEGRFDLGEPRRFDLSCKASLWVLQREGLPYVTIQAAVRSGAAYDPSTFPGLADLTGDLLDEGAAGLDALALAKRIKGVASSLSTDVGREQATFTMGLLSDHFVECFGIMADVLIRPNLAKADLARLCKAHAADLASDLDDASELGNRALRAALFGERAPYGHPVEGIPSTFSAQPMAEALLFFNRCYRPERALFVVTGDVAPEEAFDVASKALAGWEAGGTDEVRPVPEYASSAGVYIVDKPSAPQTYIAMGSAALARTDGDYPAALIFNEIFGGQFTSRLNMNLREDKGYTYGARSLFSNQRGVLPWVIVTAVQADKTVESFKEILREIEDAGGKRPVTQEEFEMARANWALRFPQNFETQKQVADAMSALWAQELPGDYYRRVLEKVKALTLDEVRAAGARLLAAPRVFVAVGDSSSLEKPLSSIGLDEARAIRAPGQPNR